MFLQDGVQCFGGLEMFFLGKSIDLIKQFEFGVWVSPINQKKTLT